MSLTKEIKRYLSETYSADACIFTTPELAAFFRSQPTKPVTPKVLVPPMRTAERKAPPPRPTPVAPTSPTPQPPVAKKEIQQEVIPQKIVQHDSFDDLKKIMRERFPKQTILENPMTLEEWKKGKRDGILVIHETQIAEHYQVLEKLVAALNAKVGATTFVETGKIDSDKLNGVRLVVAEKHILEKNKNSLGDIKIFAIESIQELIEQPNKKIALWNALCEAYNR